MYLDISEQLYNYITTTTRSYLPGWGGDGGGENGSSHISAGSSRQK